MKQTKSTVHLTCLSLLGLSLVGSLLLGACADKIEACESSRTCLDNEGGTSSSGDGDTSSGGTGGSGGAASGGRSSGGNGSGGADPCDLCTDETPVCLEDKSCAACTSDEVGSCESSEVCSDENTCVQCTENEHCSEADASVCDLETNTCVGCADDGGCEHLSEAGTAVCDTEASACVECTVATEDEQCGEYSCDPETKGCTTTKQDSTEVCGSCVADSECKADHRCVPMDFAGTPREGGYCLKDAATGGCGLNPYRSASPARESLSGAAAVQYCTINETLATCEAVRDLNADKDCAIADDCGAPGLDDGLCEVVTLSPTSKCTYGCTNVAQCPADDPGSTCAGDATGTAVKYCGG